jgi:hypothetical protein
MIAVTLGTPLELVNAWLNALCLLGIGTIMRHR